MYLLNSVEEISPLIGQPMVINFIIFSSYFAILLLSSVISLYSDQIIAGNNNYNTTALGFLLKSFLILFLLYEIIISKKGCSIFCWLDHFFITNYNLFLILFVITIMTYLINLFFNIFFQKIGVLQDYYLSVLLIVLNIPILFIVNNFFSFLFILEFLNTIIFFKLISSKTGNYSNFKNYYFSKKNISLIFYQFWATFYSNMFLFYFFISCIYIFGTSTWYLINFIVFSLEYSYLYEWLKMFLLSVCLLLGIFLKLGIAPLHIFKLEVYDGLPFLAILFYTTFYVSVFFIYFAYIFSYFMISMLFFSSSFIILFLMCGLFYTIFNSLFNIQLLKTFFALSTILNLSFFFIMLIVIVV